MSNPTPVSKPFAGFEDFDACVRENQDKEDPDAFCAWLQDQGKDALSDPNADKVLTNLTTEFVSSVGNPAQDSEWLVFKDARTDRRKAAEVERPYVFAEREDVASKAADVDVREQNDEGERQIAYAAVLIPNRVDKQGDVIPPYVVERAAHEYMAEYRKMDSDHDLQDGAGTPVESWVLFEDQEFDLPDGGTVTYPEGTWVIGKRFTDDEWERVKSGELTGFSIYGGAQAIDVEDLVDEAKNVDRRARKGVDATGSNAGTEMLDALQAASKSETPAATLADRVQAAKAELPDEDAEMVVEMLRASAEMLEEGISGEEDGPEDEPQDDEDDEVGAGDDEDEAEQSAKQDETNQMSNENDTPEDGGTEGGNDADTDGGDAVAEGIDELKSMVKGVDDKVDDFDDRLAEVEDEVETLKENVDVDDPAPGNDRLNDDDDNGARLKSVAKEAAREAVAEVAGVDDSDDPEVVRKGLREQVGGADTEDVGLSKENYSGVFADDGGDDGSVSKSTHGNKRLVGGDD